MQRYWLTVTSQKNVTPHAKSFTLRPSGGEEHFFSYLPGQFLTLEIPHPTGVLSRSYSLSSAPGTDLDMQICIKRVAGGRGSNWVIDNLKVGDRLIATPPAGRFTLSTEVPAVLFIAGGSGITPCLSLIKQALNESDAMVDLLYVNRNESSVIYRAEIEALLTEHGARFRCHNWLTEISGRISARDIRELTPRDVPLVYVCGPESLMDMAEETLGAHLDASADILTERFLSPDDTAPDLAEAVEDQKVPETFKLTLDNRVHEVPYHAENTLLEAALSAGIDAPYSCSEGSCGACMCQLKTGEVRMATTKALSKRSLARGNILLCQAKPSTDDPIWVDFDF